MIIITKEEARLDLEKETQKFVTGCQKEAEKFRLDLTATMDEPGRVSVIFNGYHIKVFVCAERYFAQCKETGRFLPRYYLWNNPYHRCLERLFNMDFRACNGRVLRTEKEILSIIEMVEDRNAANYGRGGFVTGEEIRKDYDLCEEEMDMYGELMQYVPLWNPADECFGPL